MSEDSPCYGGLSLASNLTVFTLLPSSFPQGTLKVLSFFCEEQSSSSPAPASQSIPRFPLTWTTQEARPFLLTRLLSPGFCQWGMFWSFPTSTKISFPDPNCAQMPWRAHPSGSDAVGQEWRPRICVSNKVSGGFQVMLRPLVWGPHSENHWLGAFLLNAQNTVPKRNVGKQCFLHLVTYYSSIVPGDRKSYIKMFTLGTSASQLLQRSRERDPRLPIR